MSHLTNCESCGKEIPKNSKKCPFCGAKRKVPWYRKIWVWIVILIVFANLRSCVIDIIKSGSEIKPPGSAYEHIGKNYEDILMQFKNAGFTNVLSEVKHAEQVTSSMDKEVAEVSIGGNTEYRSSDWYTPDTPVVIRYYFYIETTTTETTTETTTQYVAPTEAPTQPPAQTGSDTASAGDTVNPEFKEMLDSYESFIDEYIAFMKNYNSSDNQLAMLNDYLKFMEKYMDIMSKLDAINRDDLSGADLAYYIEVTARIAQKLLSLA